MEPKIVSMCLSGVESRIYRLKVSVCAVCFDGVGGMEAIALRSLVSSTTQSFSAIRTKILNSPFHRERISTQQARLFRFPARLRAKQSDLRDEDGNSILQRIPTTLMTDHLSESGEINDFDMLHFLRGSVDEFIFQGPKISRVKALWVSVESGQWRLGSVSLTVISCECQQSSFQEEDGACQYTGFQYDFELEDVLIGEGSDSSMLELRPSLVTELAGNDPFIFLSKGISEGTALINSEISNEESMKEYADLKFSLLFYDAILIIFGTSVASISAGENAAFAFLIGGIGGFLYLLLLQRSVDGLPAPELVTSNRRVANPNFDVFKGPISSVALAIGFAIFAVRYSSGDLQAMVKPEELIVGMMGFLACKVSVVLAAFKPMTRGLKLPNDM